MGCLLEKSTGLTRTSSSGDHVTAAGNGRSGKSWLGRSRSGKCWVRGFCQMTQVISSSSFWAFCCISWKCLLFLCQWAGTLAFLASALLGAGWTVTGCRNATRQTGSLGRRGTLAEVFWDAPDPETNDFANFLGFLPGIFPLSYHLCHHQFPPDQKTY